MKSHINTVIDSLVNLHSTKEAGARGHHLFRESLRALVRLSQSEQRMEMRSSLSRLRGELSHELEAELQDEMTPESAALSHGAQDGFQAGPGVAGNEAAAQGQLQFAPVGDCRYGAPTEVQRHRATESDL